MRVPKTDGIPTTKVSVLHWLKREGDLVHAGVLLKIAAGESVQVLVRYQWRARYFGTDS